MKLILLTAASFLAASGGAMTFSADYVSADNVTRSAVATGHVHAVEGVFSLWSERLSRDADGQIVLSDPTTATTCTNAAGHLHWSVTGGIEYAATNHVIVRNAWLRYYGVPVLWLPYLRYPLDTKCGFSWMPGYTGRWGAYLLTRYRYDLLGDPAHAEGGAWLTGATRFDMRYKNGLAAGEDLKWSLGALGAGRVNAYFAWDEYADHRYPEEAEDRRWKPYNWGSDVDRDRYSISGEHRWEPTERDIVFGRFSVLSDSYFREDFFRRTFFRARSQFVNCKTSGVFWEHLENALSFGVTACGRLDDFYAATERLPEIYLDVNPLPLWGSPVNYETESRAGYLRRRFAAYGADSDSPFHADPGVWARYDTFRLDTYHRLTAPFRVQDLVSAVPRFAYHGTYWADSGVAGPTGWERAGRAGEQTRSILEGGLTLAARGAGLAGEGLEHVIEPYLDVLAQEAMYSGAGGDARPYVFDALDASRCWEEQFAGRGRNLPYSYYGITPGLRNAWNRADERGNFVRFVDIDAYAAVQFNSADWADLGDGEAGEGGDASAHRLAEPGSPNYGRSGGAVMPGARLRWHPDRDSSFAVRAEYDSDDNVLASADLVWRQRLCESFSYHCSYQLRDSRLWDFSSAPLDDFNRVKFHFAEVGFEHRLLDCFVWSPYVRWDIDAGELDSAGARFDYLTDCIGYRLYVEYENDYTLIDGYRDDDDWNFGFQVFLRAFGDDVGSIFR